jgi:multidrug efflux pump subunit AcrB
METMLSGFKEGAEIVGSYLEKQTEKDTLKKAYAETQAADKEEGVVKPADMFKVNKLAAQMAAQRGEANIADSFEKRAQEAKKSEINNELKQFELNQSRLEAFEQSVNALDNAADAKTAAVNSNLPTQQKMAIIAQLDQIGDDPEKFKILKDKLQQSVLTAKDRLTAEQKILKMKQDHELKLEAMDLKREQVRNMAAFQAGNLSIKEFMAGLAQDKLIHEYDKDIEKKQEHLKDLKVKREKGGLTDEEKAAQATDEANTNEEIRQLRKKQDAVRRGEKSTPSKAKSQKAIEVKTQAEIDKLDSGTRFVWTDGQTYIKE